MANKFRGEYELENGMIAVLDFNALAELEELTDRPAFEVLASLDGSPRVSDLRKIAKALLSRHQPELELAETGDLLNEYGIDFIMKTVEAAQPEAKEEASGNAKAAAKRK